MALADDIDLLVSRRPGLTELALAKRPFGHNGLSAAGQFDLSAPLQGARHVERHGTGGPGHASTYHPGDVKRRGEHLKDYDRCGDSDPDEPARVR
jgi:hypothetical protein